MSWSDKTHAQLFTWGTLCALEQLFKSYNQSETIKSSQLAFWNPSDSKAVRAFKAQSLADQLVTAAKEVADAGWEDNANRYTAIMGVARVLKDENSTVSNIADTIDKYMKFLDEVTP